MKTYAPKGLTGTDLRGLLADLHTTPTDASKFLHCTERSIWRWLSDGSCPWPVLALLWHETPKGRETASCDVGNELVIVRGLARAGVTATAKEAARLARLVAISDTGAANDALMTGPYQHANRASDSTSVTVTGPGPSYIAAPLKDTRFHPGGVPTSPGKSAIT